MAQVATVTAPSLVPDLELGGCSRRNWTTWKVKWTAFATRAKLSDADADIQWATLVSALPDGAIEALETLPYAAASDRKDVDKVLKLLEAEYLEDINEIYESYVFFTRQQDEGEPIATYIAELKRLASTCNFGTLSDRLIRDRIVCGVADRSLRKTLLSQVKLDLPGCIKICKSSRTANAQAERMTNDHDPAESRREKADLFAVQPTRGEYRQVNRKSTGRKELAEVGRRGGQCQACGYAAHSQRQQCPAFGRSCIKCGGKNHFAKVCRLVQPRRTLHSVNHDGGVPSEEFEDPMQFVSSCNILRDGTETLFTISTPSENTVYGRFDVNGHPTRFQLDSGASCNVLREKDVDVSQEKLQPTNVKLRVYNGIIMRPMGVIKAAVYNPLTQETFHLEFLVVKEAATAILGATACQEMGLLSVHRERFLGDNNAKPASIHDVKVTPKTNFLAKFNNVFNGQLGRFEGPVHFDVSKEARPVIMPTRRVPLAMQDRLDAELTRLEDMGVITKQTEPSQWVSSMVVTEKKDGSLRVCIDPLFLNKALVRNPYPMTVMEEILPQLAKAKTFTVIDVKSGYWHVVLDNESSHLTTFGTPKGRYRWVRLPFGISVAADIFQKKLDEVLVGLENTARIVDDIIVWGDGDTEVEAQQSHDHHLERLMQRITRANVHLNADKLKYRCQEVRFAGYVLTAEGHRADPEKVRAISEMEHPENITELRRFCGMVNYLAKYVKGLASLMEPLHQLTRKDTTWEWMPEHDAAFCQVKKALISTPTLSFFNNKKQTVLQCDASQYGLGAAILQDGKPVAYASRALTSAEQNYAQIEKELLAVLFGCEKFDMYTFGRAICIESDHKPLQTIVRKPIASAPKRLQRMLLKLQRYSFELKYRKGTEMYVADTLSRLKHKQGNQEESQSEFEKDMETICNMDSEARDSMPGGELRELKKVTAEDETLKMVIQFIRHGWPDEKREVPPIARAYFNYREELTNEDGVVLKGSRLVIPQQLRKDTLQQLHRSHMGVEATLRRARDTVFWPGINAEIQQLIDNCEACQSFKPAQQRERFQAHERPSLPWAKVATDLFAFEGRNYMVTVDYCTNFWEVDYLGQDTTSRSVINKLRAHFARHGTPQELVTDNGPQFTSREFADFSRVWNFSHTRTSPFYPQANGQAESAVKTAKGIMRKAFVAQEDAWLAILEYRNTPSQGDSSPAQRFLGRATGTRVMTHQSHLKASRAPMEKRWNTTNVENAYNKSAKDLRPLEPGDIVRVQPQQRGKPWTKAAVSRRNGPRSYDMTTENGTQIRRNRRHLRKTKESSFQPEEEDEWMEAMADEDNTLEHSNTNNNNRPNHGNEQYYTTRSGRQVKPPMRYGDCVYYN